MLPWVLTLHPVLGRPGARCEQPNISPSRTSPVYAKPEDSSREKRSTASQHDPLAKAVKKILRSPSQLLASHNLTQSQTLTMPSS
jgi:hypothetical protein